MPSARLRCLVATASHDLLCRGLGRGSCDVVLLVHVHRTCLDRYRVGRACQAGRCRFVATRIETRGGGSQTRLFSGSICCKLQPSGASQCWRACTGTQTCPSRCTHSRHSHFHSARIKCQRRALFSKNVAPALFSARRRAQGQALAVGSAVTTLADLKFLFDSLNFPSVRRVDSCLFLFAIHAQKNYPSILAANAEHHSEFLFIKTKSQWFITNTKSMDWQHGPL